MVSVAVLFGAFCVFAAATEVMAGAVSSSRPRRNSHWLRVMSGVNPQGVRVEGFKVPSVCELDQDFLRRY